MNEKTSEEGNIWTGVPQGSSIVPILFNIYTSNIPINQDTTLELYADDDAALASAKRKKVRQENFKNK